MNQQRLLFEYSPLFVLLCLALGLGYALLLYQIKHSWTILMNRILFVMRAVLVSFIAFLLIGPILKLTHNIVEKPELVMLVDNSSSLKDAVDSVLLRKNIDDVKKKLEDQGFEVSSRNLAAKESSAFAFNYATSDLSGALRDVSADYEGKNLTGVVLVSDGIYNSGSSPLYTPGRIPVFTVGVGDTTQRTDLVLKNLAFNKIAYQGNKFPLRASFVVDGLANKDVVVSVSQGGKFVSRQVINTGNKTLLDFDFQLDAKEKGLQHIDVVAEPIEPEKNKKNNRATAFIDVVEGKKKILMIAPAPHPDIKALRAVVEKNSNYEFIVHIPGVKEADATLLEPGKTDLIVFHDVADLQGKTSALYTKLSKGPASLFLMIGTGSNIRGLQPIEIPLTFEKSGQLDEVTPVINSTFRDFSFSENINSIFSRYPPAVVPFGKFSYPSNASVLLFEQIGTVTTDRPMLFTYEDNGRKTGVLIAEGMWRWRLNEFAETEKTEAFDEVFSKLIQYLSTHDDKRKFKVFPIQNEFTDVEPVVFESQVYNDLFQQVFGNTIAIQLKDESGKTTGYNYVTSAGGTRYSIGGLKEGVYHYTASTQLNGKKEEIRGEFLVIASNIEDQNLTADFGLLRNLSGNTGGKFYTVNTIGNLDTDVKMINAKGLIHSEESFNPLINLKWVFFIMLILISSEWFLRKYLGAY